VDIFLCNYQSVSKFRPKRHGKQKSDGNKRDSESAHCVDTFSFREILANKGGDKFDRRLVVARTGER
jgi:hypothetical protein